MAKGKTRTIEERFNCGVERAEKLLSSWQGVALYLLLAFYSYRGYGWDGIDRYLTVTTGLFFVLFVGLSRRGTLATHLKLDTIDPDADHNRIEERTEKEIEGKRNGKDNTKRVRTSGLK